MQRLLLIKNNLVTDVLEARISSFPANVASGIDFVVPDPLGIYNRLDAFSKDHFLGVYENLVNPFLGVSESPPAANSVFSTTAMFNRSAFVEAGLQINMHPLLKSSYVYTVAEDASMFLDLQDYGARHGIQVPNYDLCDKAKAVDRFVAAGFHILASREIHSREDIEAFAHDRVILKPSVSCNGTAGLHPLASALYHIVEKTELLAQLDALNAFVNPQVLSERPLLIQQVSDGEGENFDALILSGGVNGKGRFWHFSPIDLKTQYNMVGRNAQTVWSPENNTDETRQLQKQVEVLLAGNKNCFYHMQFLRSGAHWAPHDLQFRMTYPVDHGLERTGNKQHKVDIIRFVFDKSEDTPTQPVSLALSLLGPRHGTRSMSFATGSTKSEALSKLGLL